MRGMLAALGAGGGLAATLERIVRGACGLLGADNGAIGLVDPAAGGVRIEATHHMPEDEAGSLTPFGVGLAGRALDTGGPVILDRYGDLGARPRNDVDDNAVLGLPIEWEGEAIGFFGLGKLPPGRFEPRDAQRLGDFARYAAVVIRHARLEARREAAVRELDALYRTSRSMGEAMDLDEVVAAYLDQVATQGRFACSVVLYELEEGRIAWRTLRGRWSPEEGMSLAPSRMRHVADRLDGEFDAGREILMADVETDPRASDELRAIQRASRRPALAFIPLMVRGRRIGLVVLSHPQPRSWQATELAPFRATAALLAAAIDRRQDHWKAVANGRRLALIEERQRIARELHDSVSQTLFGVLLLAQSAQAELSDPRLERLVEVSRRALADMREIVRELRPECPASPPLAGPSSLVDLRTLGLVETLRKVLPESETLVDFRAEGYRPQDPEREFALLRIGQEALSNSVRHARAARIEVELSCEGGAAVLRVRDDGRGFDLETPGATGFGLVSNARPGGGPRRDAGSRLDPWIRDARRGAPAMTRVVLADDHELVREGLRALLAGRDGVEILAEAADGPEAVEMALRHRPDVLIVDLLMPGFDGVEVARRIREEAPSTRVLILTNFMDEDRIREALKAGATGYLLKDVLRPELLKAIETVANGQPYLHPEVQRHLMREAFGAPSSPLDELTNRERQVLVGLATGGSNKEIAARLGVSEGTVKGYVSGVFTKLGVADRTQAALFAVRHGLVREEG